MNVLENVTVSYGTFVLTILILFYTIFIALYLKKAISSSLEGSYIILLNPKKLSENGLK